MTGKQSLRKVSGKVGRTKSTLSKSTYASLIAKYAIIGVAVVGFAILIDTHNLRYFISILENINSRNIGNSTMTEMKFQVPAKSPPPINADLNISTAIETLIWGNNLHSFQSLIGKSAPVLVKGFPVSSWSMFHKDDWDLLKLAKNQSIILDNARLQFSYPTFILGYERDKGGMLGSKHDVPLHYVNVSLEEFLGSVFDKEIYLYWTGELSQFESLIGSKYPSTGSEAKAYHDGWEMFRVIDTGLENSIDLVNDSTLWKPMMWMSHPGVVAQTHYDTQNNVFLQVVGSKRFLVFPPNSELYSYPNIHRSYRQSQVVLTDKRDSLAIKFPHLKSLNAYEIIVYPGDILYIPPYYNHRVESLTFSVSVSVLSPSATEAALADIFWKQVPFGKLQNKQSHRIAALVRFVSSILKGYSWNKSFKEFVEELFASRFEPLFPISELEKLYSSTPGMSSLCVLDSNELKDIQDLLESSKEEFKVAVTRFIKLMDNLVFPNAEDVKVTFTKDYVEQLMRWAVGPSKVAMLMYKCISEYQQFSVT